MELSLFSLSLTVVLILFPLLYLFLRRRAPSFDAKEFVRKYHTKASYMQRGKGVLVFLNPVAGSGSAAAIFETYVATVFSEVGVKVNVVKTTGPTFTCEYMKDLVKEGNIPYDGLVVISGDGLIHQVIQGIAIACGHDPIKMKEIYEKCPLIPIPAGSSNGVTSSFGYKSIQDILGGVLKCETPRKVRLLQGIIYEKEKEGSLRVRDVVWSLLHISWGCGAEFDYYQERKFRGIHPVIKNVLAPVICIYQMFTFSFHLSIAPASHPTSSSSSFPSPFKASFAPLIPTNETRERPVPWANFSANTKGFEGVGEEEGVVMGALNMPRVGADIMSCPVSIRDSTDFDFLLIRKRPSVSWPPTFFHLMHLFIQMEDGTHLPDPSFEHFKTPKLSIRSEKGMDSGHGNISVDGELYSVAGGGGYDVVAHNAIVSLAL